VELRVADMTFLALDARQARTVRPYLEPITVYASSQIYTGEGSAATTDLAGVTFVDMPWLLQRDHPAVMVYPRQEFKGEPDLERLYALGIDAWRIGQALLAKQADLTLDGVTGKLTLGKDRTFTRELVSNRIGASPLSAPMAPVPAPAVAAPRPSPPKP